MKQKILQAVEDANRAISFLKKENSLAFMQTTAEMISECFQNGGKIILAGNGGSLCDAMHFSEELTGFYRKKRQALPAIVLSEPGHLTCVSNDIGYKYVFSRGVEALGKKNDIFICLTTSGNSENLYLAVEKAKEKGLKTISFLGKTGGKMKGLSDLEWIIEGFSFSDRIQEAHMTGIHIIIEMIENLLFYNEEQLKKQETVFSQ